ncbi:competence/damage-inducible protein A [Bacillus marasmi]|uniref:competence/damage-inducible protein A n=1 Tax=Bacillus marasmi TaxID=1926279 RepID=UPI0011C95D1A|nr:competence/damage-inducible protein A [Bacillus marasmi]
MNAEIIAVGTELLLGQIVNSNAQFISKELADLGINVYYHTVVGDNVGRLTSALEIADSRSNLIIITGGLGPTKDDLTKETIAAHLGKKLVYDSEALKSIEYYFEKTNRPMTENNRKQAMVLEGSQVLPNDHGMAPGMAVTADKRIYMLLPGPPSEMQPMMAHYGYDFLLSKMTDRENIVSRVLRFFGIGEAALETEIDDLIEQQTNPTIAPLAADGEVTLRLTAKNGSISEAEKLLDITEAQIRARVGQFIYGYDETSLLEEAMKLLKQQNITIAVAESLTGGMFQQQITSVSGASKVLKGGVVCYTNEVKSNVLNVSKEIIEVDGVVSEVCARELARNVATLMGAKIGISFTGVAGPDEQEGKPVGTVFIGLHQEGKPTLVKQLLLGGNRDSIRNRTVKYGFYLLIKRLSETQSAE